MRRNFLCRVANCGMLAVVHGQVAALIETLRGMKDFLHTDIGRGRAWVRLCLERKCFSDHVEALLG